jgi:hypothetical protein
MTIIVDTGIWGSAFATEEAAAFRFSELILSAVSGFYSKSNEDEYSRMRPSVMNNEYADVLSPLVRTNRTLRGLMEEFNRRKGKEAPLLGELKNDLGTMVLRAIDFDRAREQDAEQPNTVAPTDREEPSYLTIGGERITVGGNRLLAPRPPEAAEEISTTSSAWTGIETPATQLNRTRELLPLAQEAIATLICEYESSRHNGGPPLGDRQEAIEALKGLHSSLGQIIRAIDDGEFNDGLGGGLAADAARCVARASAALRNDPVPYFGATMTILLFSALGFPDVGGVIGGAIMTGKKPGTQQQK